MSWEFLSKIFGRKSEKKDENNQEYRLRGGKKGSLSKSGYFDNEEPQLMSEEEIKMAGDFRKFEDTGREVLDHDQVNTEMVQIGENGNPIHSSSLADMINHRPGSDIVIPGQRLNKKVQFPSPGPFKQVQFPIHEDDPGKQLYETPVRSPDTLKSIEIKSPELTVYTPAFTLAVLDDAFYFAIDLPGLDKGQIKVGLTDRSLTISGEHPNQLDIMRAEVRERKGMKGKKDPILESKNNISKPSKFKYPYQLSKSVDVSSVSATMANGVLKILLPFAQKSEETEVTIL